MRNISLKRDLPRDDYQELREWAGELKATPRALALRILRSEIGDRQNRQASSRIGIALKSRYAAMNSAPRKKKV